MHVGDHEFATIVGASGCGKSTLLSMLLGVEAPSRGTLLIDGEPLPLEPGADRGVVFRRYSLFPLLTVLQNVLLDWSFAVHRSWHDFLAQHHAGRWGGRISSWRRSG